MAHSDDTLFRIVDALYAGVLDDGMWRKALEMINDYFGGAGMTLFSMNPDSGTVHRADVVRIDPAIMAAYGKDWINHDPRHAAGNSLRDGEVVTESHLVDWRAFVKSPIYNEFCLPSAIPRHMAAWVQRRQDRGVVISLQRTHEHGSYSDADRKRLSMLVPHLRRTVELKDRMSLAQVTANGFIQGMDRLPLGVLLLDADLGIVDSSRNAETLLGMGAGITTRDGRLEFLHAADRQLFLARVREDPADARHGDVMRVSRGAGLAPLSLTLLPLPTTARTFLTPTASWIVLLHAPEMSGSVPVERIRMALAVTRAEALLVQHLLGGQSVLDAAKSLHISPHTARAQLKSVYAKTGLNSQTQLVRLLLSNPLIGV